MNRQWEDAVHRGAIDELERLLAAGADIDAKDRHGQTGLMIAALEGHAHVTAWLVEHGASLDCTAKYGLSALMIAVIRGHTDIVRRLVHAGADMQIRGTGAPGFADRTALDLAVGRADAAAIEILGGRPQKPPPR